MSDIDLRDEPARHRFELLVDGELAGLADYRRHDGYLTVIHSEVDPRFRGRGLGGELASRSLDLIRARGEKVKPVCPFFARYVEEHPEYDDIVVTG
nr:GNAT family N-acetyltransferase [uncultured Actinoplanes sp.]